MEEKTVNRKWEKVKKVLSVLSILVLFSLFVFLFIQIQHLRKSVNLLSYKVAEHSLRFVLDEMGNEINLTREGCQKINEVFVVDIDEVEPHLTGINIKGKIINTSGVAYQNVKFNVTVAKQTKELNILEKINSGYSRNFKLYIPNVPIEKAEYAEIEYVSSVISWYEHKRG